MILGLAVRFALLCFAIAFVLSLWRLMRGPAASDRVLALDTMTINAVAIAILFGLGNGTGIYFEGAMLYSLFGFVGTVALCRYMIRRKVVE